MIDYAKENIKLKDWYEQLMFYLRVRGLKKPTIETYFWNSKNYDITDSLPAWMEEKRVKNVCYVDDRTNYNNIASIYLEIEQGFPILFFYNLDSRLRQYTI